MAKPLNATIPSENPNGKLISFVIPVFNEEESLPRLIEELDKVSREITYEYEYIFVNDGSTDSTLAFLSKLESRDDVVVINLSRNFGHQIAVTAGLDHADGDAVIIMDADLQDPPRICHDLLEEWERGYDVVYAQRRTRKDTLFKRFTASAFYKTLARLSDIDIPPNTGDFRLLSRHVVLELRRYREHDRFLRGISAHVGFRQKAVKFDRDERVAGTTGYSLKSMLRLSANGLLGFSQAPLQLISRVGFVVSALSVLGILYAVCVRIFFPDIAVEGWAFIVCAVFLMGGIQTTLLGIIGSYIGRIFIEVKDRPLYIIDKNHGDRRQ